MCVLNVSPAPLGVFSPCVPCVPCVSRCLFTGPNPSAFPTNPLPPRLRPQSTSRPPWSFRPSRVPVLRLPNHVCQRASGHNRCHRSRGRQLLYAIASWFLSLLCRVRHRVLTSAPPRSGFISSMTSERQVLARAQSERYAPPKPKLVRRHSTGDHVFLPDQKHKAAINAAKKNFGVPPVTVQDREVFSILALLTMPV